MSLRDIRDEVAGVLQDSLNIPAHGFLPAKRTGPYAIVAPDDPYMEQAGRFGHHTLHLIVLLVGGKGTNEKVSNDLDSYIEKATVALRDAGYMLTSATRPGAIEMEDGSTQYGAALFIDTEIQLEEN